MKKLAAALLVGFAALVMAGCASSSSGLTSVQAAAVKAVEAKLANYGISKESAPVVVGRVARDDSGNEVTLVYVSSTDANSANPGKKADFVIIVVTTPAGKLVFADVLLQSGLVSVT
jgi:hypothetical protein